jgi:hypothetical protein
MDEGELRLAIYAGGFEPKRLRLTNGQTYDVPRPASIAIGNVASSVVVEGRLHQIANDNIAAIEPLEVAAQ